MSSGNRRKTRVAISLIGNPSVLVLDDPTSRFDPEAKFCFFEVINNLVKNNKTSVIMTTHSFEDTELLSNKIGFLMDGELQCLGSLAHLKNKFKVGYELKVEFEHPERQ